MALTGLEVQQWVDNYVTTNPGYLWGEWNDETRIFGLHHKFDSQLAALQSMYAAKFQRWYVIYDAIRQGVEEVVSPTFIASVSEDDVAMLKPIKEKAQRVARKWRAVNAEVAGRAAGQFGPGLTFDRVYLGTTYYVDFDNGQDTRTGVNPDGLKTADYTADSGTGTTTLVETSQLARTASGDWDGAYIYNVTRSAGALITNSVYSAGTWTLTHGSIASQASGDTYYIIDAWLTLGQAVRTTTLVGGDIVFFRANTTHTVAADEEVDDDGSLTEFIYLIGCDSVTNDPWGDSSDVKPKLDFGSNAYYFYCYTDNGWWINRLHFDGGIRAFGQFRLTNSVGWIVESCEFSDHYNTSYGSVTLSACPWLRLYTSAFLRMSPYGVRVESGTAYFEKCTFDGGGTSSDYLMENRSGGIALLESCEFGQTTAPDSYDCRMNSGGKIFHRNTAWSGLGPTIYTSYGGAVIGEDVDEVAGDFEVYTKAGNIVNNTTITRLNGGGSSVEMTSEQTAGQAQTSALRPLSLANNLWSVSNFFAPMWPFKRWMGTTQQTVTFYIKAKGTWGTFPVASELYVQASYFDHATNATRTLISSNDVLSSVSSTVDSDSSSGQKVLNVAATTGFAVGDNIIINDGGAREEQGIVASIQAGVSLTLEDDLTYTHTAAQADVVYKEWFAFDVTFTPAQAGLVYFNIFLEKYVSGAGCYVCVEPVIS